MQDALEERELYRQAMTEDGAASDWPESTYHSDTQPVNREWIGESDAGLGRIRKRFTFGSGNDAKHVDENRC